MNSNPFLFLHGALGSKTMFESLLEKMNQPACYAINFSGHGGTNLPTEKFSIPLFATDVIRFLDENNIEQISIFGYSMGGYVAVYLAQHFPERINKVFTLATKWNWSETIAAKEVAMLNPSTMEQKIPAFAEALKQRHAPQDWKQVVTKTANLMLDLGTQHLTAEDFKTIAIPITLLIGDADKMVSQTETMATSTTLPNANYVVLENTPHPFEQIDLEKVISFLK